jgi:serine/threonine protein kinase
MPCYDAFMQLEQLGPYRLSKRIGRGGMGTVYEAQNLETGQPAAIKVLNPQLAVEEGFRERFEIEIETLKKLKHPNIVRLYGFGQQDGVIFYAMELVYGTNLEDELQAGRRFNWRETTGLGIKLARALQHAHDHGVIHRDLKPANLLLTPDGDLKLADFGIARLFGNTRLTSAGGLVGTAEYMAPEQADGRGITPQCDLYSFGGVLFAMLAGRPPFGGGSLPEVLQMHRFAPPPPVSRYAPDAPNELGEIIGRLLSKEPAARGMNARVVAKQLAAMEHALSIPRQTGAEIESSGSMAPPLTSQSAQSTDANKTRRATARQAPNDLRTPSVAGSSAASESKRAESRSDDIAARAAGQPSAQPESNPQHTGSDRSNLRYLPPTLAASSVGPMPQSPTVPVASAGASEAPAIESPTFMSGPFSGSATTDLGTANLLAAGQPASPDSAIQPITPAAALFRDSDVPKLAAARSAVQSKAHRAEGGFGTAAASVLSHDLQPAPHAATVAENRFITVEEDERRRTEAAESSGGTGWIQVGLLALALAMLIGLGFYMARPPSADTLYSRIELAVGNGSQPDRLLEAEDNIQSFLTRFPNDPRSPQLKSYAQEIQLQHLQRRMNLGPLLSGRTLNEPIARDYDEAIRDESGDPERAAIKLQAIVDFYGQMPDQTDATSQFLNLSRRELAKLLEQISKRAPTYLKLIDANLSRADALRSSDPNKARALWSSIVALYGDKPWAASRVAKARAALDATKP